MVCCVQGYTAFPGCSGSVVECLTRDQRGRGFEPQSRRCVVSLSKTYNPSLVLVQSRETRPYITEKLVMGRKESNQTNKYTAFYTSNRGFAVTTYFHYNKGYHCKAFIFETYKKIGIYLQFSTETYGHVYCGLLKRPVSVRCVF